MDLTGEDDFHLNDGDRRKQIKDDNSELNTFPIRVGCNDHRVFDCILYSGFDDYDEDLHRMMKQTAQTPRAQRQSIETEGKPTHDETHRISGLGRLRTLPRSLKVLFSAY